ncbi:hypothetical protein AnigIFM60653_001833, partial [Aspergillus niger]
YAHSTKKTPADVTAIAPVPSRKMAALGRTSRQELVAPRFGGRRLRQSTTLRIHRKRSTNPTKRIDHPQPRRGINDCNISGNITPPSPLPVKAKPLAKPRLALNQCDIVPIAGVKRKEEPMPLRMDNDKMN